jgi:hypothetical protein
LEGIAGAAVMVTMAVEDESPTDKMRVYNKKANLIVKSVFIVFCQRKVNVAKKKGVTSPYASAIH